MDVKRTGSFDVANATLTLGRASDTRVYGEVVEGLIAPAVVLSSAGIVVSANSAFSSLLQVPRAQIEGEPLLSWIRRAGDREAFGRELQSMRRRAAGHTFVRELEFIAQLGPATRCSVRAAKMPSGHVLLTSEPSVTRDDPATELGRAVTRALDALDQGVLLVDAEGRIVHANPAVKALLGGEVVGRGFLELAPPSHVESFARALALSRAGSWHGEVDLLRLDGEPVAVELSLAAGAGEGAPAVLLVRDLRSRRRRQFVERLTAQVDRALVSSSEPREAVTAACTALLNGLGARRAVVVTHFGGAWERWIVEPAAAPSSLRIPHRLRIPADWQSLLVEPYDATDPMFEAVFGVASGEAGGLRLTLRAPGGVVGYLLVTHGKPAKQWGEAETQLLGQLATQLALGLANGLLMLETRALAAYQGRMLDQTTVLLNSVDAEGRIVTWNRASERLLGIAAADAQGRVFGEDVARAKDPAAWRDAWAHLNREGVITREMILVDARGADIPLHLEGRLLREGRDVTGAVLVGLDLRTRRALEGQVLRTQKLAAMGVLAAGIAHEINNPLTGVVGYSKLLLEKSLAPEIREKIERIAASGERCRKIVEGVLLFSRQQGGARARVDLRGLIDRVTRIGEYQWKMHNIRIVREHDESVEVMCDPDQIEQVLLNLFSNAVDAMERGGTIHVSLQREADGSARLSITDEGSGIPEEIQASIFDPFFSTKDIGKGTGLGLAISYGIVRDHGGDILLRSKPGQGATFTIHLPPDGTLRAAASDISPTMIGTSAQVGPHDAGPQDSGTFSRGDGHGGPGTGARR